MLFLPDNVRSRAHQSGVGHEIRASLPIDASGLRKKLLYRRKIAPDGVIGSPRQKALAPTDITDECDSRGMRYQSAC